MKYGVLHEREGLFIVSPLGWAELAPFPGLSRESLAEAATAWVQGLSTPSTNLAHAMIDIQALPDTAHIPLNALLTDHLDAPWEEAVIRQQEGYHSFKLKVGGRALTEDVQRVLKLRAALGAKAEIRLDANRTWTLEQALAFARQTSSAQVAYIEEPLQQAADLSTFAACSGMNIALDESLVSTTNPVLFEGLVALVLKPSLLGWERTWHLGQWAVTQGLKVIISSTFETGLMLSFLARLATHWSPHEAAGLDTWRAFPTELCPWYRVHQGEMTSTPAMRTQPHVNPLYFQKWEV